jgi:hypothetical protein
MGVAMAITPLLSHPHFSPGQQPAEGEELIESHWDCLDRPARLRPLLTRSRRLRCHP